MFRKFPLLSPALAASSVLVTACTVGPDHVPPAIELPAAWSQPLAAGLAGDEPTTGPWWRSFGDDEVAALVERALLHNHDLREALARLSAARALRGVAAAEAWPTLDGRASFEDRQDSRNTPFGAFIPRTNIHAVAVDAAWELDLWGRVRRSIEAADRALEASEADVRAAAVSVAAEVVLAWCELRAAQQRLRIAEENLALQQRTLELVRARLDAGLVVERDAAQAATNVEATRARMPALEAAAAVARNRLAVLLGTTPAGLGDDLRAEAPLPALPVAVAVGVPADLLRRRPDVHASERRFAAAVARIGAVEAERYPRFSLGGTLGLAANAAGDVFRSGSDVVAFGPSVRWSLFDGGRLRQRVRSLEAEAEAAQVAWERTVLLAVEEAENAMTRFVREQQRREALARAAAQARRAVELARSQYRAGLSDFQAVIDGERTVAAIEDDLVASEAAIAGSLVAIFKALGGGLPAAGA